MQLETSRTSWAVLLSCSSMPSYKQLSERHSSIEIDQVCWCPRFDLLAIASQRGDVILQRLFWKKAWHQAPIGEGMVVNALCWAPDGQCLAIAYSNGAVRLCEIEQGRLMHEVCVDAGPICSMLWHAAAAAIAKPGVDAPDLAPRLPVCEEFKSEVAYDLFVQRITPTLQFTVLLVATTNGHIFGYLHGLLPFLRVDVRSHFLSDTMVLNAFELSTRMDSLCVVATLNSAERKELQYMVLDSTPLAEATPSWHALTCQYAKIFNCERAVEQAVQAMQESWEDILVQIDMKFTKFAREKFLLDGGTVGDDLLMLLAFGTATAELEQFLLHDLTEKGLKRLGVSVDNTYSSVQRLAAQQLQVAADALFAHVRQLRDMVREFVAKQPREDNHVCRILNEWLPTFGEVLAAAGSFSLKIAELQDIIANNLRNFKRFFRWLYASIVRLAGSNPPPEMARQDSDDLHFVSMFIKENFLQVWDGAQESQMLFKLETVGQYLQRGPVQPPPLTDKQQCWEAFIAAHPDATTKPFIFNRHANLSLIDVKDRLGDALHRMPTALCRAFSESVQLVITPRTLHGPEVAGNAQKVRVTCAPDASSTDGHVFHIMAANVLPCTEAIACTISDSSNSITRAARFHCSEGALVDFDFYGAEMLGFVHESIENGESHLGMASMSQIATTLPDKLSVEWPTIELDTLASTLDEHDKYTSIHNNAKVIALSLCGPRKLGCVLLDSRTRLRLLDMDPSLDDSSLLSSTVNNTAVDPDDV